MVVTLSLTLPEQNDPQNAQKDVAIACSEAGKTFSSPQEAAAEASTMYMLLGMKNNPDPRNALAVVATFANIKDREAIVLKSVRSSLLSFPPFPLPLSLFSP